jgi:phenylpropionate dioxygenase-like ring-hydroxylating dioxygenase large terminal subunit
VIHVPTRGDAPPRLGPGVQHVPDYGPRVMSSAPYTDPVQFELEREKVLGTQWLLAGRSSQVTNPGDWISYEGHGETVVITRQPDGSLAGFHNVCRHRGPAFVTALQGCGARRFSCPYHGWVYDTTGALVGVPEREDFAEEHLAGLRAPAVAAQEWGGWVFINLAADAAVPLIDSIGPEIALDLGRFEMDKMVVHDILEWDVPVSYKAIVDGFNEIYHTTALHHVAPSWTKSARDSSFHIVGNNYMCFVPRSEQSDELAVDWDHHRHAICHYVLFPNTIFNCNPQHIQVFHPIPIDVDRTRFLCYELIYDGDRNDPEYEEYYQATMLHWERLTRVVGEDIGIYEQLKRTKRSSAYTQHVLSERECKLAHYHETMARMIQS